MLEQADKCVFFIFKDMCVCLCACLFPYRSESYKAFQSPYLIIFPDGSVTSWSPQVLVSACKMQVHKFPFDMQTCNISFRSITHTGEVVTCV